MSSSEKVHPLDTEQGPCYLLTPKDRDRQRSIWGIESDSSQTRGDTEVSDPFLLQALRAILWKVSCGEAIPAWSREMQFLRSVLSELVSRQSATTLSGFLSELGLTSDHLLSLKELEIVSKNARTTVLTIGIEAPLVIAGVVSNQVLDLALQSLVEVLTSFTSTIGSNLTVRGVRQQLDTGLRTRTNQTLVSHAFNLSITVAH